MEKLCKTAKAEQKKEALEKALLELMALNDYNDISVIQICEKTNAPRRRFYQYFSTKDDLLHSMIIHFIEKIDYYEIISISSGYSSTQNELSRCLRFWKENKRVLDILEKNHLTAYLVECIAEHTIEEEKKIPMIRSPKHTVDSDTSILFMVGGTMSVILAWYKNGYPESIENLSQSLNALLTSGCFDSN